MTMTSENAKPITAYCRSCGKPLTEDTVRVAQGTVYCEEHAPPLATPAPPPQTPFPSGVPNPGASPGLAFLLGLIPGVGAIYNGQYAKGVVHVLIFGMLISITNSSAASGGLEPLFGMLIGVFYFYMAFEAYHTARKRQIGETVDEFSSLVKIDSGASGFPVGPTLLIGLGTMFLLNNFGLLRLSQLLRFWPVILIAIGATQLYQRMRPRGESPSTDPTSFTGGLS